MTKLAWIWLTTGVVALATGCGGDQNGGGNGTGGTGGTLCPNGIIDSGEDCEGDTEALLNNQTCVSVDRGFVAGTLACNTTTCLFDYSGCKTSECGNGTVEADEVCDDPDNDGSGDLASRTCANFAGKKPGDGLRCTAACDDFVTTGCEDVLCGNDTLDSEEACDLDNTGAPLFPTAVTSCADANALYDGGTLGCTDRCAYDLSSCTSSTTQECDGQTVEGNEVCDGDNLSGKTCASLGLVDGQLQCASDCSAFDSTGCLAAPDCGNDTIETGEDCDVGSAGPVFAAGVTTCGDVNPVLDGGTLQCAANCAYDLSACTSSVLAQNCNGNALEGSEVCDGLHLDDKDCSNFGLYDGTLGCNIDCTEFDTNNCVALPVCGDDAIDDGEACDKGSAGTPVFPGGVTACEDVIIGLTGTLGCTDACAYDLTACTGTVSQTCDGTAIEGTEVCDGDQLGDKTCANFGFRDGTLACNATCDGFVTSGCYPLPVCGNDAIEEGEDCDRGDTGPAVFPIGITCAAINPVFDGGSVGCSDQCVFDLTGCTSSANGQSCDGNGIEGTEVCDGDHLSGKDCSDFGWADGTLACAIDCTAYDTSGCDPAPICGDDAVDANEDCDKGSAGAPVYALGVTACADVDPALTGGSLGCSDQCTYDLSGCTGTVVQSCDGQALEGVELCDGSLLNNLECADFGFPGGTLACNATCDGFDFSGCWACGNGVIDQDPATDPIYGEQCEPGASPELGGQTCADLGRGFVGGTLGCNADCSFDFTGCETQICGNDQTEGSEVCDGSDLNTLGCDEIGWGGGLLACEGDCSAYDIRRCSAAAGGGCATANALRCANNSTGSFVERCVGGVWTVEQNCPAQGLECFDPGSGNGNPLCSLFVDEGDLCDGISRVCSGPLICTGSPAFCKEDCSDDATVCDDTEFCDTAFIFNAWPVCEPKVGRGDVCGPLTGENACTEAEDVCMPSGVGVSHECRPQCPRTKVNEAGTAGSDTACAEGEVCLVAANPRFALFGPFPRAFTFGEDLADQGPVACDLADDSCASDVGAGFACQNFFVGEDLNSASESYCAIDCGVTDTCDQTPGGDFSCTEFPKTLEIVGGRPQITEVTEVCAEVAESVCVAPAALLVDLTEDAIDEAPASCDFPSTSATTQFGQCSPLALSTLCASNGGPHLCDGVNPASPYCASTGSVTGLLVGSCQTDADCGGGRCVLTSGGGNACTLPCLSGVDCAPLGLDCINTSVGPLCGNAVNVCTLACNLEGPEEPDLDCPSGLVCDPSPTGLGGFAVIDPAQTDCSSDPNVCTGAYGECVTFVGGSQMCAWLPKFCQEQ